MIKRICIMLLVTFFVPISAGAYPYNQQHTFQTQLEAAQMKTVSVSVWRNESYAWMQTSSLLGKATGTMIGDGLILTNAHLIKEEQNDITIKMYTGSTYTGELLKVDKEKDLALIRFECDAVGFTFSGVNLYRGKPIMTVGQPTGLPQWSYSEGKVQTPSFTYTDTSGSTQTGIETDASVIVGGSGGPLLDERGELVGIVRAASEEYSFAIPIDEVKEFLQ